MASNFKILIHRKNRKVNLKLVGDFDGTAACELLNVLKDKGPEATKVVVDASRLKEVYPFGVDTFQNNLHHLKDLPMRLVFVGENAAAIEPQRDRFF
jgi:hypothetical protein